MSQSIEEQKKYEKRRWRVYFSALILLALITAAEVRYYYQENVANLLYVASCLAIGYGTVLWCIYDSKARGLQLSYNFRVWLGFLGPIFIPIYFYKTRGGWRAVKSIFGLALYIPFYVLYYATWYLTGAVLVKMGYYSPA